MMTENADCNLCKKNFDCPFVTSSKGFCAQYKQKKLTNGDRIRSMSNDDLAILLARPCSDPNAATECLSSHFNPLKCIVCWLKWLKQEADTDD